MIPTLKMKGSFFSTHFFHLKNNKVQGWMKEEIIAKKTTKVSKSSLRAKYSYKIQKLKISFHNDL